MNKSTNIKDMRFLPTYSSAVAGIDFTELSWGVGAVPQGGTYDNIYTGTGG